MKVAFRNGYRDERLLSLLAAILLAPY
jgi:hypothetical protein